MSKESSTNITTMENSHETNFVKTKEEKNNDNSKNEFSTSKLQNSIENSSLLTSPATSLLSSSSLSTQLNQPLPSDMNNLCRNIELLAIHSEEEYNKLLKKQKQMLKDSKNEKLLIEKRKNEMYKIQMDLRKKFIETNDFIRQCERKNSEADKQIENELLLQNDIKNEIEKYKADIKDLEEFKNVLQETVKEFEPYERVMDEVVKELEIVKSAKECMDRCDALMLAQDEITNLEKTKIESIEKMKNEMVKATNEASLIVLGLNNELAQLEHLYDASRTECMKWEKVLATTKNVIISNELKTSLCVSSINQMYNLLCKRNGWENKCDRNDIEKQLDLIKNEIEILQNVVKLCEKE